MLRRRGRALLADEMGCGKTIQAISLISAYLKDGPILVVCPASVRSMWCHELEKWLEQSNTSLSGEEVGNDDDDGDGSGQCYQSFHIRNIEGQCDAWSDPLDRCKQRSVTVTSYAMLKRLPEVYLLLYSLYSLSLSFLSLYPFSVYVCMHTYVFVNMWVGFVYV
jgi:SNF2 family DNA or RNA helicase